MKLRLSLLLVLLLFMKLPTRGQDSVRCGNWISATGHYGFIVPLYSNAMDILIKSHVPAAEVDFMQKTSGSLPWQHAFHCPETGLAFYFAWLGNPTQLGNMIGVYPFVNLHLQKSYREELYLRLGIGLGYMPVIYNRLTNHKNNVIGSHLNAMINLRLNAHFYLSEKLRLEAGLGVTHCSDGNYQDPNLGLNVVTFNTGLSYCIRSYRCVPPCYKDTVCRRDKSENDFYIGAGLSEIEPPGGPKYGAVTLNYTRYYRPTCKNKVGVGMDLFYNYANVVHMSYGGDTLSTPLENIQVGLKASYELTIGKISLPLEVGGYVYTKYKHTAIYDRIGIRYYANKHLILTQTLLLHLASADYMEWGVGYRL